jgi:hypothetical protein
LDSELTENGRQPAQHDAPSESGELDGAEAEEEDSE